MISVRGMTATLIICLAGGCSQVREEDNRFALSSSLEEISGLAAASDSSVYAHDDEHAIVHELRVRDGETLRVFALGEPSVEGDFEGIATADGQVFLITSDGLVYAANIGEHRSRVTYRVHDTGIGMRCEIEGLSRAPTPDHLLVLCKKFRRDKKRARLEIYRWKIGGEQAPSEPWLSVPLDDMLKKRERSKFAPSALEWDGQGERLLVVSARSKHMLVLDKTGELVDKRKLDGKRHRQTEGLTILADRRIVLADEGNRTRKAYLTTYREP